MTNADNFIKTEHQLKAKGYIRAAAILLYEAATVLSEQQIDEWVSNQMIYMATRLYSILAHI